MTRHFFQVVVCTAHIHSVTLYYATNLGESRQFGVSYSRPEFLYFWVYYVGFNLPWLLVPLGETRLTDPADKEGRDRNENGQEANRNLVLLADSFAQIRMAFQAFADQQSCAKKR